MTSKELRKKFLEFFEKRGHTIVKSSSLLPDDPSVLLTTAGMQQFKAYYVGRADAMRDFGSKNVASAQKCFRTSDIDEVGDDTHLTFFEMLGNFSFGGYLKKEAIRYAYEFVIEELRIERDRIYVTVFAGDETTPEDKESYGIWHEEIGLPKDQIRRSGRADNWWGPTGNEGPCGPTTEIYVAKNSDDAKAGKGVEIWNIVFNEYFKDKDGNFNKLEVPGIDTGMGFERLVIIMQGVNNIYETDLFTPIIKQIREVSHDLELVVLRILADHLRASIFLIADGVRPSNKEAGYVLRRLLRRMMAYSSKYDIHADLFPLVLNSVAETFGEIYPEVKNKEEIMKVYYEEKDKFNKAIGEGLKELKKYYHPLSAKEAFYLQETFGLYFDLLRELIPEQVRDINENEFNIEVKKHQEISRAGAEKKFGGHGLVLDTGELKAGSKEDMEKVIKLHTATHLLQKALRNNLGDEIKQMGSDINPERGRFDFSFTRKLTEEEVKKVEDEVNNIINQDLPVYFKEMPIEEAKKTGALFFFKEKYPNKVRVYFIGPKGGFPSTGASTELSRMSSGHAYSVEFCGGPHVEHTLQVGKFKIQKQESVGAGTRRVKFVVV